MSTSFLGPAVSQYTVACSTTILISLLSTSMGLRAVFDFVGYASTFATPATSLFGKSAAQNPFIPAAGGYLESESFTTQGYSGVLMRAFRKIRSSWPSSSALCPHQGSPSSVFRRCSARSRSKSSITFPVSLRPSLIQANQTANVNTVIGMTMARKIQTTPEVLSAPLPSKTKNPVPKSDCTCER
jgi:hypothetical protein